MPYQFDVILWNDWFIMAQVPQNLEVTGYMVNEIKTKN